MSYNPPRKNAEYIFPLTLISRSTGQIQSNPTLAAGDFKVSTDFGTFANLATLPSVVPGSTKQVKVTVAAAEMNGDNVLIIASDAAGAEWDDVSITIQPSVSVNSDGTMLADLKQIDEQATNGNNATLKLKMLDIRNSTGLAILASSSSSDGVHFTASAPGAAGLTCEGTDGIGAQFIGDTGDGLFIGSYGGNGHGLNALGNGTGKSVNASNDIAVSDGDLTLAAIADATWDEAIAGHLVAGSTGAALNAAGAAGDPWTTTLPGVYGPGTAGDIIGNNLDATVSSRAAPGDAMTLTAGERNDIADALLDLGASIETNLTLREALRLIASATAGKLSGAATATITLRSARADDKSRIIATVDADGNRTAIVYDVS